MDQTWHAIARIMLEGMVNTYFRMDASERMVSASSSIDSSSTSSLISESRLLRGSVSSFATCFIPSASPLEGKRMSIRNAAHRDTQKREHVARMPTADTMRKKKRHPK